MENVADALKMAGAVLLFVLALSVAIFSFGRARETSDVILSYKDRETEYIDGNLYYKASGTERIVGLETIIPSIYRAYIENYKIVFNGLDEPIYSIDIKNGAETINKYTLDLETNQDLHYRNVVLTNNEQKSEFLCGILYGKFKEDGTPKNNKTAFQEKFNVKLPDKTLYDQLLTKLSKGYVFKEYLGVYYQDDNDNVPEVNKTEKRIITYVIEKE